MFKNKAWILGLILFLSPNIAFAGVSTDTCFDTDTVLMLHMNGTDASTTFTDSSSNPKTMTANGSVQLSTSIKKFGSASGLFVSATSDYVSTPHSSDFDFSTNDFTIEMFVYFTSTTGDKVLFSRGNGTNGFIYILLNSGNTLYVTIFNQSTFSWSPSLNTWYHLAITRNGTNLRAFVDGTQIGSTATNSDDITSNQALHLGATITPNTFFDGYEDELRIIKGLALYTSNFTAPLAEFIQCSNRTTSITLTGAGS